MPVLNSRQGFKKGDFMEVDQSIQEFLEFVIGALIENRESASIKRRRDDERVRSFLT